jgi:hypothetical protein
MTTKRQQTMAKITRERAVKEKRERKLEKKRAAKAERKLLAENGGVMPAVEGDDPTLESAESELDPLLDPHQPDGDDGAVLGERVVPGL